MLPAFGGQRWWPLTARVVVLDASVRKVAGMYRRRGRRGEEWRRYPDLATLMFEGRPFHGGTHGDDILVATADGRTAAFSTSLRGDLAWLEGRAKYNLRCAAVSAGYCPPHLEPGNGFVYVAVQDSPPLLRKFDPEQHRRELRLEQLPTGEAIWLAAGEARPFESPVDLHAEPEDRLSLDVLAACLRKAGVPADDPDFLSGEARILRDRRAKPSFWSGIPEYRRQLGFPADRMPTGWRWTSRGGGNDDGTSISRWDHRRR